MSAYGALASSYDELTRDVSYESILQFLESVLSELGRAPRTVLDLACGTGSLSILLSRRGYEVTGADISEEMLTEAADKAQNKLAEDRPLFICQPMQELSLPQPVDLAVCCLDSLNYLVEPDDCRRTFARVYAGLNRGGVFFFDVNTPEKLRSLDGQIFLDETDDAYCVWRAEFDKGENICYYGMDLFQRAGTLWRRSFEEHAEYAYDPEDLARWLLEAGFSDVRRFGDQTMEPPGEGEQRIYFAALKE